MAALTACGSDDHVIERFRIEGHGMSPTIEDGEQVEVLEYADAAPARGDIIEFAAPTSPDRLFIKRVIGLPGDTIEAGGVSGNVLLNGEILDEPYAKGFTGCSGSCTWTIPTANTPESRQTCGSDSCYFVLGDNRQNSSDSRQGWLVPVENIVGFIRVE